MTPAAGGPPGPAAAARQANPVLPPEGQNAQGFFGFINRFFGPPVRARNAGQGRQALQGLNNAQGQVMGQPPGIFINYQVQYQFPRQQLGQQAQQPHQPLHPIPLFPGFPGPGGVWQPWLAAEAPADPAQTEAPGPRALNNPSLTPTVPHDSQNSTTSTSSSASSLPSDTPPLETPLPTPYREEGSLRARDAGGSPQMESTNVQSTSSANSSQLESSSRSAQADPPHLIPLYDYRLSPSPLVTPLQRETASSQTLRPSNRFPPRRVHDFSSHASAIPLPAQQQRSSALPHLSPSLTDEQLANLDRLTRESIDERLRILEGVSSAVYRCIDDLMRLRSAIPPTTMDTVPPETSHSPFSLATKPGPSSTIETEVKDPITSRGKEKMLESLDVESTTVASSSTRDSPPSQSSETDI